MNGEIRSRYYMLLICVLVGIGTISVSSVLANTGGVPSSAPGYHPGLFTSAQGVSIPAVVNTYEGGIPDPFVNQEQNISFSIYPGDLSTGKKPSLVGFLSAGNLRAPVNIFGRMTGAAEYQYLATVIPDDQGIFVWEIPVSYYGYTDFQVKPT
ncbi:MAG: hypothetical protein BWY45_01679 [Euryarchaeota archaeon ADurb.Bin294]|jgi:hypothetical protein|nr:hypothetical protein [Methanospirillum sp.]OQA56843.1 MAG: hypothetical protein BWY45_01679 [Euryarchaeota archaeon ADurb.Bin294]